MSPAKTVSKPTGKTVSKAAAKIVSKPSKTKAVVHESKNVFQGNVFWVSRETITEPNGVHGTRDVIRHNGSVVIMAIDSRQNPSDPTILIERQYRYAAGQYLLELPAGRIEPGEAPLAAAKRELIEETGYRAKRWSKLVKYFASPGFLSEYMQVYLAEDIREGIAEPEEDEKIALLHIPLSELVKMIGEGKILDGKTIVSAMLLAERLRG